MPIPLPDLDDHTFDDLMAEAQAMIPALTPAWTNFNESDPGMVLLELLAWLSEMLLYQVDQVSEANTEAFLALLNEPGWQRDEGQSLETAVFATMTRLRRRYRAVTLADYERLVQDNFGDRVARVRCTPVYEDDKPKPGHLNVVIVPRQARDADRLHREISAFLDPRRLLTVQHRVVAPASLPVWFTIRLAPREDVRPCAALRQAGRALRVYFDSRRGGPDGDGWPFGRALRRGDLFALLDRLDGVDYVSALSLHTRVADEARRETTAGVVTTIRLHPGELVELEWEQMALTAVDGDGREVAWKDCEENGR